MSMKRLSSLSILTLLLFCIHVSVIHASVVNRTKTDRLANGLLAYWTFDGPTVSANSAVTDMSGNGNTGTLINIASSTFYSSGKIGQAFNFDGVNDSMTFSNLAIGTTHTVSLWVYP